MQLPDEFVEFQTGGLLAVPLAEGWSPLAELRAAHLLSPERLEALRPQLMGVRMQLASEREMADPPARIRPLEVGFIDYPTKVLDGLRRKAEASDLGKMLAAATRLRADAERVVLVGSGMLANNVRALFDALCHPSHNELPERLRMGTPCIHFAGDTLENDGLQDLLDLLDHTCVDPLIKAERWGTVLLGRAGDPLETLAANRILRGELIRYYVAEPAKFKRFVLPILTASGRLRDLCRADGLTDDDIHTTPDNIGTRFGILAAPGLIPAAIMGLDVRALLLGASAMTRRFFEEPLEKNPVLQFAACNFLMSGETGRTGRTLAVWSSRLGGLGRWYEALVSESLCRAGKGPIAATQVLSRDAFGQSQALLEGPRTQLVHHLRPKATRHPAIAMGMDDRNEDELNSMSRKSIPDMTQAAVLAFQRMQTDAARPFGELSLPAVTEHAVGQLVQMLMLATVVEAKLMGVNPFLPSAADGMQKSVQKTLRIRPEAG